MPDLPGQPEGQPSFLTPNSARAFGGTSLICRLTLRPGGWGHRPLLRPSYRLLALRPPSFSLEPRRISVSTQVAENQTKPNQPNKQKKNWLNKSSFKISSVLLLDLNS